MNKIIIIPFFILSFFLKGQKQLEYVNIPDGITIINPSIDNLIKIFDMTPQYYKELMFKKTNGMMPVENNIETFLIQTDKADSYTISKSPSGVAMGWIHYFSFTTIMDNLYNELYPYYSHNKDGEDYFIFKQDKYIYSFCLVRQKKKKIFM